MTPAWLLRDGGRVNRGIKRRARDGGSQRNCWRLRSRFIRRRGISRSRGAGWRLCLSVERCVGLRRSGSAG